TVLQLDLEPDRIEKTTLSIPVSELAYPCSQTTDPLGTDRRGMNGVEHHVEAEIAIADRIAKVTEGLTGQGCSIRSAIAPMGHVLLPDTVIGQHLFQVGISGVFANFQL